MGNRLGAAMPAQEVPDVVDRAVTPAVLTPAQLRIQLLDARQQYADAITRGDYTSAQAACRQINRLLDQWPRERPN